MDQINKIEAVLKDAEIRITTKSFVKESLVFLEGDTVNKICIVRSGSVLGEKTYPDGDVHIVNLYEEGDVFALEIVASETRLAAMDYVCNEDAKIGFASMASIEKSAHAEKVMQVIAHMLADENIRQGHKLEILSQRSLRDRIMVYLRILEAKADGGSFNVKMSREQMAQFLCVNRSALSNELNKMKKDGLIEFKGSNFRIVNSNRVKA